MTWGRWEAPAFTFLWGLPCPFSWGGGWSDSWLGCRRNYPLFPLPLTMPHALDFPSLPGGQETGRGPCLGQDWA